MMKKRKETASEDTSEKEKATATKSLKKWELGVDVILGVDEDLVAIKKFVKVPTASLKTIRDLVGAAKLGGGGKSADPDLDVLERIINHKSVKDAQPKSSEATYAIGKAGTSIYSSGPSAFGEAVELAAGSLALGLTCEHIGSRATFTHGEIHIVSEKPGVTAVYATQPCCLFCYGYLQLKNISNPGIRQYPFPKGWIHPDNGLKLSQKSPATAAVGSFAWVGMTEEETALYRVE